MQHDDRALGGIDGIEHALDVEGVGHAWRGIRDRRFVERCQFDLEAAATSLPVRSRPRIGVATSRHCIAKRWGTGASP